MKRFVIPLLIFFLFQSLNAQKNIYIDKNGKEISKKVCMEKWRNKDSLYSAWMYLDKHGNNYMILKKNLYLKGTTNYNEIKNRLEKIIRRKIKDSSNILISYYFKNDLCTSNRDNKWDKIEIAKRKKFTNPIRKELTKKSIEFITLFNKEITLQNKPKNKNEYFYKENDDFFKKTLFVDQTLCGSFAIIKPNGEYLIRNGEYRADLMAEHLKLENWKLFFDTK